MYRDLLACFFTRCETQFRFLEREHGYTCFSGLAEYKNGRQIITPYRRQDAPARFHAVTLYKKEDGAIEITYGEDDFSLEIRGCYNRINCLFLYEILQTAQKPCEHMAPARWTKSKKQINETLSDIARSLEENEELLLRPGDDLIERALTMRGIRIQQQIIERHKKNLQEATSKAAKAFRIKDYTQTIELLMPYKDHLNAADLKKLEKARQYCLKLQ